MKIEILMLLESEMKGNNPTILNENEYEIEEIELFDEDDDFSSESSANKFKIVEMDDCYIICKTPKSPLTYNEKSKLVTYKANENAVYYVEIVGLKGLKCKKELKSIKKYLNEL